MPSIRTCFISFHNKYGEVLTINVDIHKESYFRLLERYLKNGQAVRTKVEGPAEWNAEFKRDRSLD